MLQDRHVLLTSPGTDGAAWPADPHQLLSDAALHDLQRLPVPVRDPGYYLWLLPRRLEQILHGGRQWSMSLREGPSCPSNDISVLFEYPGRVSLSFSHPPHFPHHPDNSYSFIIILPPKNLNSFAQRITCCLALYFQISTVWLESRPKQRKDEEAMPLAKLMCNCRLSSVCVSPKCAVFYHF